MIFQLITDSECVLMIDIDGTISCVPNCDENRHWQMYQAWLLEGNEPLPAE